VQLRFVTLCQVMFTLCCITLCSNIVVSMGRKIVSIEEEEENLGGEVVSMGREIMRTEDEKEKMGGEVVSMGREIVRMEGGE
jgi:hypothetical protein